MPYALCPMPYAQSYLIFLRKAIYSETDLLLVIIVPYTESPLFSESAIARLPSQIHVSLQL